MARWFVQFVFVSPCQCSSPGGVQTVSPVKRSAGVLTVSLTGLKSTVFSLGSVAEDVFGDGHASADQPVTVPGRAGLRLAPTS
jgi:hypothetical protein